MHLRLMEGSLIPIAVCSCRGHLAHPGFPEQGGERCQGAGPPAPAALAGAPRRRPSQAALA